jgi:hypothetical protein
MDREEPIPKILTGRSSGVRCFIPLTCNYSVELPGIETDALPGNLVAQLPFRSMSVQLSNARYLRFRFRVLTASMLTIYCPGSQDS